MVGNKTIEYKGKVLETKFYKEITDLEYEEIVNEYYTKPDFEKVKQQFIALSRGG